MTAATVPVASATLSRWSSSSAQDRQNLETNQIIARHLAGDERAFGEIILLYRPRLIAFIYRMIGDRERAEDLVQEAFIRIHRHLHRFDSTKKFSTWAYTIASNLAKNELRNRSRNPLVYYQSTRVQDDEDQRPLQFEDAAPVPTTCTPTGTSSSWWTRR